MPAIPAEMLSDHERTNEGAEQRLRPFAQQPENGSDEPMNQFDGELAALRNQREMDALGESPGVDRVLDVTVKLAEKVGLPPFMGLFRKVLKLGQPSLEKMVEDLEAAAYEEIRRIRDHLHGQAKRQEEFEARLNSQEAHVAYLSACFHGLRTSDPQKHSRLALLTINCVFVDDLKPESLDGMMRAAVELTEDDISLLGRLRRSQRLILENIANRPFSYQWYEQVGASWEGEFSRSEREHLSLRGSLMRLRSLGFIAETGASLNGELAKQHFGLLFEGKNFYERLQEISAENVGPK